MAETMPEPEATASNRRSFLKKAGVAAGAAWVAPAVLSQSAFAQGSGPVRIPFPPFPFPPPPIPLGPPPSICGAGPMQATASGNPVNWTVQLFPPIPVEFLSLNLVGGSGGAVLFPPPNTVVGPFPAGPPIVVQGGGGAFPSFFDVFVDCNP